MRKMFALMIASIFLFSMIATAAAYPTGFLPTYPPIGKREIVVPSFVHVKIPTYTPAPILTDEKVEELAKNVKVDNSDPHEMDFYIKNEDYVYNNDLCKPVPPIDVRSLCPWAWAHGFKYPIFP